MGLKIAGIGTSVPTHRIRQVDALAIAGTLDDYSADQRRFLKAVYLRSGVEHRHSVLLEDASSGPSSNFYQDASDATAEWPSTQKRMERYELEAGALAFAATEQALDRADMDASVVTHLVTVSCSGFHAPGFDIHLIDSLGMLRDVARTHVGFMGCHGSFNALRVADSIVRADSNAVVLVCSVELCSLHFQRSVSRETQVSNALFADGAGAVVCVGSDEPLNSQWGIGSTSSWIVENSADAMTWRIGDHGFEMTLSSDVPNLIRKHTAEFLANWLTKQGLGFADVASWAVHPGGPKILTAFQAALELNAVDLKVSHDVLRDFGNMSSATIFFLLERLMQQESSLPCVAVGFGPGLAIEAILFQA